MKNKMEFPEWINILRELHDNLSKKLPPNKKEDITELNRKTSS